MKFRFEGTIRCPRCQSGRSRVRDSRGSTDMNAVRRRRHCIGCGNRYTTYESTAVPEEHVLGLKIAAAKSALADLETQLNALTQHISGDNYGPPSTPKAAPEEKSPVRSVQVCDTARLSEERLSELLCR